MHRTQNQKKRHPDCLRRAFRTFLQSACGVLTALMAASLLRWLPADVTGWKAALLVLTASAVAAGIAAAMNHGNGE